MSSGRIAIVQPPPKTKLGRAIVATEKWTIVVILLLMAILPTLEAIRRRINPEGVKSWILFVQMFTLWIGFLGALLATRTEKHLALSTGELIPEGRLRRTSHFIMNTLAAVICAILAVSSFNVVHANMAENTFLPPLPFVPHGAPQWWGETIMPVALSLMALRFAWRASPRWALRWLPLLLVAAVWWLAVVGDRYESTVDVQRSAFGIDKETEFDAWLEHFKSESIWPKISGSLQPLAEHYQGWGLGLILLGLGLGMPVFVAMAGAAMLLFVAVDSPLAAVPNETLDLIKSPTLPAIPLLAAAGYVMAEGGAGRRLMRFARGWIGWIPGGMAVCVCLVSAAFTTLTGGSGVTILALGGLLYPMLREEGYPEGFSLGLITSAGSLGLLFYPSFPVLLYAIAAKVSYNDVYVAAFLPCLLLIVLVAAYGVFVGVRSHAKRTPFGIGEAMRATGAAGIELLIPAIVIGALLSGFATLVEASAIALILAIISEGVVHRDRHLLRDIPGSLERAATLVGAVVILLGVAMGLKGYLVDEEIPAAMLAWTKAHIQSPTIFLLVLNGILLVLGSVLEIFSAIFLLAPLLAPLGEAYGVDKMHMGVIFLANLELGFLFPPMGLNLILSSSRFEKPLPLLYRVALPFLFIMAGGVLLVTYVPAMTSGFLAYVRSGAGH